MTFTTRVPVTGVVWLFLYSQVTEDFMMAFKYFVWFNDPETYFILLPGLGEIQRDNTFTSYFVQKIVASYYKKKKS